MLNKTIMFVAVAGLLLASASVSNAGIVAESWISGAPQADGWACIDHYSGSPPARTDCAAFCAASASPVVALGFTEASKSASVTCQWCLFAI